MKVLACKITEKEWADLEALIGDESVSSVLRKWVRAYLMKHSLPTSLPIKEHSTDYRQGDKPTFSKEKAIKFDAMERR